VEARDPDRCHAAGATGCSSATSAWSVTAA